MKLIIAVVAALVILFLLIRYLEYKSLYFPLKKIEASPKDIGLEYEDVKVTSKDGVLLSAWFISASNPRATILFSHGNGGNISHRLEKIGMLNFLGLNVLIFDYRGYGKSTGRPSEKGLYGDADAMLDYLITKKGIRLEEIIVYGESLGGAIAVDLAGKHELGGMIIEETFTSVKDMAKQVLPVIPSSLLKSEFDSLRKIKDITVPKLIFHSSGDEIVPFEQGKRLFDEALEPKEFVELQGGHNDAFLVSQELFIGKIDAFVNQIQP